MARPVLNHWGKGQGSRKVRGSEFGVRRKNSLLIPHPSSLIALFLLLLAGCVTTNDYDSMRSDLNQLKRDVYELKKDNAEAKKSMAAIKDQTSGTIKEETLSALRESQASILSQVSDVSKDLQMLRGRFDENKFFMDKSLRDNTTERELLRSQMNSLETRMKELNDKIAKLSDTKPVAPVQKPPQETEAPPQANKQPEKPAEEKKPDEDPAKAYESAYNSFKDRKYRDAREKFSAFLKKHPKDGLAGNAQFWIAETYYAEKDYEGAILAYESVIKDYPHSEKIPGALLKQGFAFAELGDKKTAKVILEKLIEKYPSSREADAAKKKKAEFEKNTKKPGKR